MLIRKLTRANVIALYAIVAVVRRHKLFRAHTNLPFGIEWNAVGGAELFYHVEVYEKMWGKFNLLNGLLMRKGPQAMKWLD